MTFVQAIGSGVQGQGSCGCPVPPGKREGDPLPPPEAGAGGPSSSSSLSIGHNCYASPTEKAAAERIEAVNASLAKRSTRDARAAETLSQNIRSGAEAFGLEKLGFLTLTFKDPLQWHEEAGQKAAHRRLWRFGRWMKAAGWAWAWVMEPTKSGRIHFHVLVGLPVDIRTGFDWSAVETGDYRSASAALRSIWAQLRRVLPRFGFGRHELLPIKSTAEGISRYVGKYLGKAFGLEVSIRQHEKGEKLPRMRRCGYSHNWPRRATMQAQFVGGGHGRWRMDMRALARIGITEAGLLAAFGPRWAYKLRDAIMALRAGQEGKGKCPAGLEWTAAHWETVARWIAQAGDVSVISPA